MKEEYAYDINLDVKFKHLEKIDIPTIINDCDEKWFNQTLTRRGRNASTKSSEENHYFDG